MLQSIKKDLIISKDLIIWQLCYMAALDLAFKVSILARFLFATSIKNFHKVALCILTLYIVYRDCALLCSCGLTIVWS